MIRRHSKRCTFVDPLEISGEVTRIGDNNRLLDVRVQIVIGKAEIEGVLCQLQGDRNHCGLDDKSIRMGSVDSVSDDLLHVLDLITLENDIKACRCSGRNHLRWGVRGQVIRLVAQSHENASVHLVRQRK